MSIELSNVPSDDTPESLLRVPEGAAVDFPIDSITSAAIRAKALLAMILHSLQEDGGTARWVLADAVWAVEGIVGQIETIAKAHQEQRAKKQ